MRFLPAALLLAAATLTTAQPTNITSRALATKPNLPLCPSTNFAEDVEYNKMAMGVCQGFFTSYLNIPVPKANDIWKLHKGNFWYSTPVKTFDGQYRKYKYNIGQHNGDWPGLSIRPADCAAMFTVGDVEKHGNVLCTVQGDGGWHTLVQGWREESQKKGYATADFWVNPM